MPNKLCYVTPLLAAVAAAMIATAPTAAADAAPTQPTAIAVAILLIPIFIVFHKTVFFFAGGPGQSDYRQAMDRARSVVNVVKRQQAEGTGF